MAIVVAPFVGLALLVRGAWRWFGARARAAAERRRVRQAVRGMRASARHQARSIRGATRRQLRAAKRRPSVDEPEVQAG